MHDALADVLTTIRLRSAVFCRADVTAPWAVSTTGLDGGIFHAVLSGHCTSIVGDDAPIALGPGDVILLPHGDAHVMADRPGRLAVPIRGLVRDSEDGGVAALCAGGGGERTVLVCGRFDFERRPPHPLLSLLPRAIHLRASDPPLAHWLAPTVRLIASEIEHRAPGGTTIVTRLTDVLVVHAIRTAIETGNTAGGWLGALRDPRVGRALDLVHAAPRSPWTADSLAERVGMSRSSFFARFTALVGEPPAQYVARWRMHLAARWLREERASVAEVADRVGYASEAAFSKAFKRLVGSPPSDYRREVASGVGLGTVPGR